MNHPLFFGLKIDVINSLNQTMKTQGTQIKQSKIITKKSSDCQNTTYAKYILVHFRFHKVLRKIEVSKKENSEKSLNF